MTPWIYGILDFCNVRVYSHTSGEPLYFGPGDGSKHTSGESIIQEIPDEFQYAVVMCYEMDYEVIQHYSTHVRWGDPLYVWADKMMGYGKAKSAYRFWKEWRP